MNEIDLDKVKITDICPGHAELREDMSLVKQSVVRMEETTTAILATLRGNGGKGVLTEVELVKSGLSRAWWWLGGVSLSILALAVYAIRGKL